MAVTIGQAETYAESGGPADALCYGRVHGHEGCSETISATRDDLGSRVQGGVPEPPGLRIKDRGSGRGHEARSAGRDAHARASVQECLARDHEGPDPDP